MTDRWSLGRRFLQLTRVVLFAGLVATSQASPLPREGADPLQGLLDRTVAELGLDSAAEEGRLAIAVVRLDGERVVGLGLVNGHQGFYAASLPKIAILYGAAVSLDEGRVELDDALHDDLVAMIRSSCNPCANRVLDRIDRRWLLELLQHGEHRFYDPDLGGGLWVGKDYAPEAAYRRDPLHGFSHKATAWQAARFYTLLVRGELASPASTTLMLEALSNPAISHKFVAGLAETDARLYRKSGTWRNHHADSALVVAETGSYILVGLARDREGGRWLEQIARALHRPVLESGDRGGSPIDNR
ncbi:MAG: serine hydrolase [Xanthomonadales bacterium]|nr:serine hydrolase [Xanthomonadales bacterium]